jgi:L-amino acid N-acyltransferase YncA
VERSPVRDATAADLAAVAAVYEHEALHGIATFDAEGRPEDFWAEKLGGPLLVAEVAGSVAGFAYASTYRPRPGYDRTREVSVYLAADARGQGVGRALYAELLDRLRAGGVHTALAVIALPNEASARLHESFGFVHRGTIREVGWKFGRWIDTGFWQLTL